MKAARGARVDQPTCPLHLPPWSCEPQPEPAAPPRQRLILLGIAPNMRLSSFRRLSELGSGEGTEDEAFKGLWDLDVLNSPRTPFKWEHLVALLIVILSIVAGRWLYDGFFRLLRLSPPLPTAPLPRPSASLTLSMLRTRAGGAQKHHSSWRTS